MGKKKAAKADSANGSAANLGFEAKLWLAADNRLPVRRDTQGSEKMTSPPPSHSKSGSGPV